MDIGRRSEYLDLLLIFSFDYAAATKALFACTKLVGIIMFSGMHSGSAYSSHLAHRGPLGILVHVDLIQVDECPPRLAHHRRGAQPHKPSPEYIQGTEIGNHG